VTITLASKPTRRESVSAEYLPDGSGLLFEPDSAVAYPISESAVYIWKACDGSRDVNAILDELESRYLVQRATLEADTLKLLAEFAEKGLLEAPSAG
jgi:hypothetical protein